MSSWPKDLQWRIWYDASSLPLHRGLPFLRDRHVLSRLQNRCSCAPGIEIDSERDWTRDSDYGLNCLQASDQRFAKRCIELVLSKHQPDPGLAAGLHSDDDASGSPSAAPGLRKDGARFRKK